jgi:hypothetical protein
MIVALDFWILVPRQLNHSGQKIDKGTLVLNDLFSWLWDEANRLGEVSSSVLRDREHICLSAQSPFELRPRSCVREPIYAV